MSFKDREAASQSLAKKASEAGLDPDVVLCCSVEGFEVARVLSEELDAELDIRFTTSIKVPGESDVAVAGVADDGTVWVDKAVKDQFRVSGAFIDRARIVKARLLGLEKSRYSDKNTVISGKKALIVDDSVVDSNRMAAAIGSAVKQGAVEISVAAPIISQICAGHIKDICDSVVWLEDQEASDKHLAFKEADPEKLKEYEF